MKYAPLVPALGIGLLSGVLGALCGVGGGIVMVPAFVNLMGLSQKQAIATSLIVIIPTALTGGLRYAREGLVDWRVAAWTAVGAIIAAAVASDWLKKMQNETLTRLFAVVLILVGLNMLFKKSTPPSSKATTAVTSDQQSLSK